MNGIEKITARITADVEAEIQAIQAESAARCEAIRASYDEQAQAEYWRLVKSSALDCEQRIQRAGRTAGMEAKKAVLALKQTLVAQAFDMAVQRLLSMPEGQYVAFLARQAATAARTGQETVAFNAGDRDRIGEKVIAAANEALTARGLAGKLQLSREALSIRGGLILQDGDIQINCAIEQLLEQYRDRLAAQVAEVLFAP